MRTLITGGYGFAGRHLAHHLVSCGDDVIVSYYPKEKPELDEKYDRGFRQPKSVQSVGLDITDKNAVEQLIGLIKPEAVYHLAALTFVPEGEENYTKAFETNTYGTINLLDAVSKFAKDAAFLMVSSSEVYGDPRPGTLPLTELATLRPASMYGISKAAADLAAFKYSFRHGLNAIRVRPFPHFGPGQSPSFAISSFAKQLAEVKLGKREPKIKVGNLEARRDYSDVSDIVRGYREALLNGKRGEVYNLCTGTSVQIGELLQKLIKIAEVEVEIEVDPERVRPIDILDVYGSNAKALKDFGWKPRIDLEPSLHGLFAFWMETLAS